MEIADSVRRHGEVDDGIRHAVSFPLRSLTQASEEGHVDRSLIIGPARDGRLLEVVVLGPFGLDPVVIHAMTARKRLLR